MAGDLIPRPAANVPVITTAPPPWEGQRKRESESALRWLRTRRHWTVPAAVPLAALGAAAVVARLPEVPQVALIAFAWAFAAAVALFARHKWTDASGEPRWPEVIYAIASAVTAAGWLTAACFTGVTIWSLVPLAALGLAWGVPWWWHKRPRGARKRAALIAKWDGWWQSLALHWGLGGSAVIGVSPMGVTTRLRIQGLPGRHSIQHVRQVMHLIESGLDGYADIGMIRAEPVKGKPSQFDLFLKKENPLRRPVNYDLALAPRSVHEPLVKGLAETGAWKTVSARRNTFTIGETRSGKSNDLLVKLAQLTGCSDDWQILIDLKGGRSARPVLRAGAAGYVVTEVDEARMTLRMLGAEATARAKHAYVDEEEQLLASDEIPALHCMVDETHGLTSVANGDTECVRLMGIVASQGNGLEIYLDVYTQHGSLEESVRTEQIRANLPQRTVYRVAEARHGAYVIPEYHKLDASRLEEKGTCYLKDGKEAFPEQVRAPHMPHALLRQVATANAALVAQARAAAVLRRRDVPGRDHVAGMVGHPLAAPGPGFPQGQPAVRRSRGRLLPRCGADSDHRRHRPGRRWRRGRQDGSSADRGRARRAARRGHSPGSESAARHRRPGGSLRRRAGRRIAGRHLAAPAPGGIGPRPDLDTPDAQCPDGDRRDHPGRARQVRPGARREHRPGHGHDRRSQ